MNSKNIQRRLFDWYNVHKRELPWRNTKDPYLIWISEIILQQTRVDQGMGYYLRFVDRFPTVDSLANEAESEVLRYWQGLGYYSRARNIYSAAKMIMSDFGGVFPKTYEEVKCLKGVGDYTAAAICSFAYGLPYAVVDGNVYRVLSRLFGVSEPIDSGKGKKIFAELAQELLSNTNPGDHNQAMMEFGAMQCVPRNPDCTNCVLNDKCVAFATDVVSDLPVKIGKTVVKNRYFNYFIIRFNDSIYLQKREANDIWRNLYELPLIETEEFMDLDNLIETDEFNSIFSGIEKADIDLVVDNFVHILSHRRIMTTCYMVEVSSENEFLANCVKVSRSNIEDYAVSRLTQILLDYL
ncbi:MAG: A/G-specific adenine glycosylase [Bacteroidales bacterium]